MKVFCKVRGKSAVVVGYGPGRKGRIRAIVLSQGKMIDVALKDIELDDDLPEHVGGSPSLRLKDKDVA